jgi:hypothetical protein
MPLPEKDEMYLTRNHMLQEIMVDLGGRIAEELVLDDITTGASNDIQKATAMARQMVTRYGMSARIGTINYEQEAENVFLGYDLGHESRHSEYISGEIDKEVKLIIDECYKKAKEIIKQVFHPIDMNWRGFPVIPKSVMAINNEFAAFDAHKVHEDILAKTPAVAEEAKGCSCGQVLRGLITSEQCPMFGKGCKPTSPMGPCMVSAEGNCNIAYRFRGRL